MPHSSEFATGILNAVSANIAVVAATGEIVTVNEAWRTFARDNGNPAEQLVGVGANYLQACRAAEDRGDDSARSVRLGIEAVLRGQAPDFHAEYACHTAQEERWFSMRVTPIAGTDRVVVAHQNISTRKRAEGVLRQSQEQLERRVRERTEELERSNRQLRQASKVFDSTVEAIMITDARRHIVAVNRAFTRITGYEAAEVMGRNPRVFSSGRHGPDFYANLWHSLNATGRWQGEIWNRRKNGEIFPAWENISMSRGEQGEVVDYVAAFSDISAVKQAEDRLAYLAHHDPLTGLANRLLFSANLDQAIERARRHGTMLALLFIDMDNFKVINDSLGHVVGDHYLKTIARRLRECVRSEDTVARLGGDEFAILAEDLTDASSVGALADKLVHVLAGSVQMAGHDAASSASIGVSLFPGDATNGEDLLKAADAAMYQAKGEGRNTARFFRREMGAQAYKRLALESGLRQAIVRQELLLHYQPMVDMISGECVGLEALVRWASPEHGLMMPEAFIPLAEETRLIQPIGRWVLGQALQDLATWRAQGLPALRLAVNVSWRQFNDERFVDELIQTLDAHGLQTRDVQLDLEVTESALQSRPHAVEDLQRLRDHGVRVTIDDFGTGHSSLSQLMHLPVDGLKIDRMFLRDAANDVHGRAIIRAVIALARGLGLDLVAEGVETEAQAQFLRAEGCRHAQGFLFGAPVPAADVPALIGTMPRTAAVAHELPDG